MTYEQLAPLESQLPLGYKLTIVYSGGRYAASLLAVSDDSVFASSTSDHAVDALIDLSTSIKEKT